MRIAIVHGRKYYLRNITTTLEALAERDHELVFSMSERKAFTRRVPRTLRGHPRISMAVYPAYRDDGLDGGQRLVRALRENETTSGHRASSAEPPSKATTSTVIKTRT